MSGSELLELRQRFDLTQRQLGDWLGYSVKTIKRWEADRMPIARSPEHLLEMLAKGTLPDDHWPF